ncbi:MAG TPA: ATP-binding protein [Solirubrobacteraceae bacterium]|jgi:anti-sigma regulatory factor (Ser/Thr protein kinase)|nr:ATP-binding protein [Solirubrobacteraceae bacterium]
MRPQWASPDGEPLSVTADGLRDSARRRHDLALTLPAHPSSVAVVRELLRGLRGLEGRPGLLNEVLGAVSEAANNVVMHAYENGGGRLSVDVCLRARLEIRVRDWGRGLGSWARPTARRGVGLMAIDAFTDEFELRAGHGGGTEVWLSWGVGAPLPDCDDGLVAPVRDGEFVIDARPGAQLGAAIGRVTALVAGRAGFTLDLVDRARAVAEQIMAYADAHGGAPLAGSHLSVVLNNLHRRRLGIRAGPLRAGHASTLCRDLPIPGEDRRVVADPAAQEWLELVLEDGR